MVNECRTKKPGTPVEVLAIIPARGGSKSIPRKNIRALGGVPLIGYSIAAAQQARTVTRVIVSTDDEEIARIAESFNVEVPFLRPADLARDETADLPVFQHALRWLEKYEGYQPEIVVQLRPTSPFRPSYCVDDGVRALLDNPLADSVRAVAPSEQNPYKMWRRAESGMLLPLLQHESAEPFNEPRQNLPQTFWQTGHLDVARYETIMSQHSMTGSVVCPLVLDPAYAVDIDTPLDWERAEWLLERDAFDVVRPPRPAHRNSSGVKLNGNSYGRGKTQARRFDPAIWQSEEIKRMLSEVRLLALDFDGVLTDNRVMVRQDGMEAVMCDRADGLGLAQLRERGVEAVVLSTETNPCVTARTRKLGLHCVQGCDVKFEALQHVARERNLKPHQVAFVGNDVNDLECLNWVGLPIAVADAEHGVLSAALLVTSREGGRGAVREVTDAIIAHAKHQPALSQPLVKRQAQTSTAA